MFDSAGDKLQDFNISYRVLKDTIYKRVTGNYDQNQGYFGFVHPETEDLALFLEVDDGAYGNEHRTHFSEELADDIRYSNRDWFVEIEDNVLLPTKVVLHKVGLSEDEEESLMGITTMSGREVKEFLDNEPVQ